MTREEAIYKAIREVCNTDNPKRFVKMNQTIFDIAKRSLELMESQGRSFYHTVFIDEESGCPYFDLDTESVHGTQWITLEEYEVKPGDEIVVQIRKK